MDINKPQIRVSTICVRGWIKHASLFHPLTWAVLTHLRNVC
jgi:hypothetical protein